MTERVTVYWRSYNPSSGCSKRFPCWDECWARGVARRFPASTHGCGFAPTPHPEALEEPLHYHPERWKDVPLRLDGLPVVATSYMGDLFDPAIPFEFIAAVYGVEAAQPGCAFLHLTKTVERRAEFHRWLDRQHPFRQPRLEACYQALRHEAKHHPDGDGGPLHVDKCADPEGPWPLPHVWEGTSVSTQTDADERIPVLLRTPAAHRWLSVEPLLGPVDLTWCLTQPAPEEFADDPHAGHLAAEGLREGRFDCRRSIDLVIVGPETGSRRRACDPAWIASIVEQCEAAGVRVLVKGKAPTR